MGKKGIEDVARGSFQTSVTVSGGGGDAVTTAGDLKSLFSPPPKSGAASSSSTSPSSDLASAAILTGRGLRTARYEKGPRRVVAPGDWYGEENGERKTVLKRAIDTFGEEREEWQGSFEKTKKPVSPPPRKRSKTTNITTTTAPLPAATKEPTPNEDDRNSTASADGIANNPPDKNSKDSPRLFLVTFHLPIVLSLDVTAQSGSNPWSFHWDNSMISKTDGSISGDLQTVWVGCVPSEGYYIKKETGDKTAEKISGAVAATSGIGGSLQPQGYNGGDTPTRGHTSSFSFASREFASKDLYTLTEADQCHIKEVRRKLRTPRRGQHKV